MRLAASCSLEASSPRLEEQRQRLTSSSRSAVKGAKPFSVQGCTSDRPRPQIAFEHFFRQD